MAQKSVKDSTGRTYASALNSLRRVLVVLRGSANADPLTITKDELAEVLANMGRMRGNDPCGAEKGSSPRRRPAGSCDAGAECVNDVMRRLGKWHLAKAEEVICRSVLDDCSVRQSLVLTTQ